MKYLGVVFSSGTKFSFNVHLAKQKFFRSVNAIFGKIGTQRNSGVVLSLINSFCIPVLLYGLEAFSLKKSNVNKINSLLNTVYSKVFNVSDNQTILECHFYSGQLPLSYILDLKTLNFHKSLITVPNSLSYLVNKLTVSDDISKICLRYDIVDCNAFMNISHSSRKQSFCSF